jgi:GTPase
LMMDTTTARRETAILVGIYRNSRERTFQEESLLELEELTRSAGAEVADTFLQEKASPDPAFLIGRGKLEEIRETVASDQTDMVIFDEDLTPAQLRNLERHLEVKVIDRSELILDIFAQRARSSEGKLQVELAQLEYLLPRLTGKGVVLSRLGGGIGTRGPGETKLEVDRRTIRGRISRIKAHLSKLEERRALHRQKRRGIPIPTVSLVGYTNAGKSTLFNRLTDAGTYVSSRMFATLDPLVRKLKLDSGQEILLSDTVGFIRKLPHTLIAAFHATLEETLEADMILHVIDASQENYPLLRQETYKVLAEIGMEDTPILEAYNKLDLLGDSPLIETPYEHVLVSARTGSGIAQLAQKIELILGRNQRQVSLLIPFDRADIVAQLRERGRIEKEEYGPDGIHLRGWLALADLGRYSQFLEQPNHVSSGDSR